MMKSRIISAGAIVLMAMTALSQSGGAAALRAAAEFVAKERVKGTVEVDPREMAAGAAGSAAANEKLHSGATLTLLAIPGVATVANLERARMCATDPSPSACKTGGRAAFLALSAPVVNGKTATVEVRISAARALTAADSAQASGLKSAADRDALLRRLARPTATRYRVELVRETTAWIVTRAILVGAS